jgi:phosphate transport system substrate-binding protein
VEMDCDRCHTRPRLGSVHPGTERGELRGRFFSYCGTAPVAAAPGSGAQLHSQVDVIVKGGGSGPGIAALLYGTVDICMASRDLSDKERGHASNHGVEISGFDLALDGITIVVHPHNPVDTLSLDQLRKIYAGNVRNWQEVGGAPADIVALSRLVGSGTAALFRERVLGGEDYAEAAQGLPTNEAIVAEVATRPWAIGYTDLGALRHARDRVKAMALRATPQSMPVLAVPEMMRSGRYPLARTLHFSTAGKPSGTVKAFIDFCLSSRGHALVQIEAGDHLVKRGKP